MPRWWRDVLAFQFEDEGVTHALLVALRDGYLNVYAQGQSVLKIGFDARRAGDAILRCRIHRKYVRGPQAGDGYDLFDGLQVTESDTAAVIETYNGLDTLRRWVEAARSYAGDEKKGVAVIAARHPEVIDVEMALPANAPKEGEAKVANRMDIVALEEHGGVQLVFYEAKLFFNPELRANDLKPRVLGQLQRYCDYVTAPDRRAEVIAAYQNACMVLAEIAAMRGSEPAPLVRAVADGAPLALDPAPRLVVFGHKAEQVAAGSSWQRHADALRDGGVALVLAAEPHNIVLRRPEGAVANTP
jgi:hypothetical protein